jgi:hypothetical protein
MTRFAFPTDEHRPFQDDYAIEIALQIVRDFNPDILVTGSDGVDFYNISKFDKNPLRMKTGLQKEITDWQSGQRQWKDAAKNAVVKYIVGNHEDRLRKYLWQHQEISDLDAVQLPNILGLASLGIEWETQKGLDANREVVIENKVVIKHGGIVRKFSAMSAKAELENERFSISVFTGHTHRGGVFYTRTRNGVVQAVECFCLCDLNPEYVRDPDWQHGIVLGEVVDGNVAVEPIPFLGTGHNERAIWRGREYRTSPNFISRKQGVTNNG